MIPRRSSSVSLAAPALAQPATRSIPGTGATGRPIEQMAQAFTRATGRAVRNATFNGGQVAARIRAGEVPDVVLNAGLALDRLISGGFALAAPRIELGRMRLALAIRRGGTLPDMATEAGLATHLRGVASIGVSHASATATSGRRAAHRPFPAKYQRGARGCPRRNRDSRHPGQRDHRGAQRRAGGPPARPSATHHPLCGCGPDPRAGSRGGGCITPYVTGVPTHAPDPAGAAAFIATTSGPVGPAMFRAAGFAVG